MTQSVVLKTLLGCTGCMATIESLNKCSARSMDLMTLFQFGFVTLIGLIVDSKFFTVRNRIPIKAYVPIVVVFFAVSVANNKSLSYDVPVPLYIIFRSSSLVSNLIVGWLWCRHTYSRKKVLSVVLVSIGILLFTMETTMAQPAVPQDVKGGSMWIGLLLMAGALVLSSFLGIYQEGLHKTYGKHPEEAMFYVHFLSLPAFLLLWNSIKTGLDDCLISPPVDLLGLQLPIPQDILKLILISVLQWICVRNVYRLTSVTSALNVTMVLTLRKFLSFFLSVCVFKSAFTAVHGVAVALVTLGTLSFYDITASQILASFKAQKRKEA
ncbi:hypothetical protein L596_018548 [Steinernema carpocapsae]|uniref:Sugar phosphate transporter domain-containing protein n=1 Tax=Steinernema carpocapsae TaxID=34508 RepID=A0A4U5N5T9_STECR|nr:hypothetical protein L596_018548 [Steinernema carpocapsae]